MLDVKYDGSYTNSIQNFINDQLLEDDDQIDIVEITINAIKAGALEIDGLKYDG